MQDGNIHINIGNVSSKDDIKRHRSAIAAASYQSGKALFSDKRNRMIDAREAGDGDVKHTQIIAPKGAPDWVMVRATLWNNAERDAYRKDARLAKKIEVAFTRDIPDAMRLELLLEYIKPYIAWGCIADIAIHNDDLDHNPHAHIMLTTQHIKADGFVGKGGKIKPLDERQFVKDARKAWADLTNQYLKKVGSTLRVDHRSYKARGIEAEPTKHRGPNNQAELKKAQEVALQSDHQAPLEQGEPYLTQETSERTEDVMAKPSLEDKKHYPLLSEKDTWPPAREAAPDMTAKERDEHQRYWQEQDDREIEIIERQINAEIEQEIIEQEEAHQEREPKGEYANAIEKAQKERGWISNTQREYVEDMVMDRDLRAYHQSQQNALYKRAVNLRPNREENELRGVANKLPKEQKQAIHSYIISRRMVRLQNLDNQQRRIELEKDLQAGEKDLLKRLAETERYEEPDRYPEQGPNGELLPPSKLEQAQSNMIAEVEKDNHIPEPEHDANEWQRLGRARDELMKEFEEEQERER